MFLKLNWQFFHGYRGENVVDLWNRFRTMKQRTALNMSLTSLIFYGQAMLHSAHHCDPSTWMVTEMTIRWTGDHVWVCKVKLGTRDHQYGQQSINNNNISELPWSRLFYQGKHQVNSVSFNEHHNIPFCFCLLDTSRPFLPQKA